MFFHTILKIIRTLVILLLCVILAANLYIITARLVFKNDMPRIFGFAQVIVMSGSMQPAVNVGDMLIIREQNSYMTGDIVTYRSGQSFITHRLINISDTEAVTKGDANNIADSPIRPADIEGKTVLRIPGAGDIVLFLKTPFGILAVTIGLILIIEISFAAGKRTHKKK